MNTRYAFITFTIIVTVGFSIPIQARQSCIDYANKTLVYEASHNSSIMQNAKNRREAWHTYHNICLKQPLPIMGRPIGK